ncbi:hypothetical protein Purlil1_9335 [Purpureocillium lilacinum]|uniref:Uncharacterized protein n=1 Tax=Purpureocillium lilacinum TaxID=33203 RepID=A0ABR0BQJ3_PURLI|nr:hypothetical protein Purlil1_9335 [Purpureocillium lilacinum]
MPFHADVIAGVRDQARLCEWARGCWFVALTQPSAHHKARTLSPQATAYSSTRAVASRAGPISPNKRETVDDLTGASLPMGSDVFSETHACHTLWLQATQASVAFRPIEASMAPRIPLPLCYRTPESQLQFSTYMATLDLYRARW